MLAGSLGLSEESRLPREKTGTGYPVNAVLSAVISMGVASYFFLSYEACRHWFVVPLFLCGVLMGADAAGWLRGKIDPFDPVGLIGLMLYARYFIGTFFNVTLDHWLPYVTPPPDWRPWVGWMAWLNLSGFGVYQLVRFLVGPRRPIDAKKTWTADPKVFFTALFFFLGLSAIFQVGTYLHFGGISGYIAAYESRSGGFEGMGAVFMVSESFPVLFMMGVAVYLRMKGHVPSWVTLVLLLLLLFALRMFFGGLRGSRSDTIWALFWAVGIIHFWIRPVPKRLITAGIAGLMLFVYVYGFYKGAGLEGLQKALNTEDRIELEQRTGRTRAAAWLSGGTQPYTLYRLSKEDGDYEYSYGRTYLASLAKLIPRALWPDRPPSKVKEGTELFHGRDAYPRKEASQIWGLAGEAMLNFGPAAVPAAFAVLGVALAGVRRWMAGMDPEDTRWLLMPFFVSLCIVIPGSDSDNLIFHFFKNGMIPILLVFIGSASSPRRSEGRG